MMSSKEKIKLEVTGRLDTALNKLYNIWHDIGIDESQMQQRAGTVSHHLCNLLEEMVEEESTLRNGIQQNIVTYTEEVKQLTLALDVQAFKPNENLPMLQIEKELRTKMETLQQEKSSRMKTLKALQKQDQHLCDVLCAEPIYIASGSVPTKENLRDLEKHITSLTAEKESRFKEFVKTKKAIVELFSEIERSPDNSFQRDLLCEDDDTFQLSQSNMRTLKLLLEELEQQKKTMEETAVNLWLQVHALWDRLEVDEVERETFKRDKDSYKTHVIDSLREEISRCEKLKFQNIQRFVEGIRRELCQWWDRCFYSRQQRDQFDRMTEENYTEDLLEHHERELERVRSYYENHKELLDTIAHRENLFQKMIEFERKANDPNRYKNRRHNCLLQEEKERKKLLKELPKVEEQVKESVRQWEVVNHQSFLVEGVRYNLYIEKQREAYEEQKKQEKELRQKAKARQIQEEMIFGSRPTTPKRQMGSTPQKTPSKVRKPPQVDSQISVHVKVKCKLNDSKTPSSVSRIQHSSVFASPYRRAPMSASKTPNTKSQKRRSLRLARQVLAERNTGPSNHKNDSMFSQTTVSSKDGVSAISNGSISSTGSYQDFASGSLSSIGRSKSHLTSVL